MINEKFLPFSQPAIDEDEIAEVADSLRSGWITTGPKVKRFETDIAAYLDARHTIAVNSCTAGLHIALTALGIGPSCDVILPTMTFCSTANVVVHLGARPVLVDVGDDLNVLPEAIEAAILPRTRAIIPVHYGGQPCDLNAIYDIAARHNLPVVEDAAHAIGASYNGYKIGSDQLPLSQDGRGGRGPVLSGAEGVRAATCFSFYPTKNMTTGEGGMIAVSSDELADQMRLLTLHGMNRDAWKRYTSAGSWYYEVVAPGYKANMTDIQASLGIHQLKKLDGFIETRQRYARIYDQAFAGLPQLEIPVAHPDRSHIYHLYAIRLNLDRLAIDRAQFIEELKKRNIGASVHFIPVHLHPYYRDRFKYKPGSLPRAESLYNRILSLPLFPRMTESDLQRVIAAVQEICKEFAN